MTTEGRDGGVRRDAPGPPAGRFRHWAAGLFDQQLWCWGRDVARPDGNVLLDLGMCRHRSPGGGSSLYTAAVAGGGAVWLWGFGVLYTEPGAGGVFVRRYDFAPRLTPAESALGVHDPDRLPGLTRPVSESQQAAVRRLLPPLAGWVARYEHWVAEALGTGYRERCLAARSKSPVVPARNMATAWERAAKKCRRLGAADETPRGPWAGVLCKLRLHPAAGPAAPPGFRPGRPTQPARPWGRP